MSQMGKWIGILAFCLIAAAISAPVLADERVMDPSSNYIIDAQINGHPVRLKVDFDAYAWVMINPAVAARVGLDGSMIKFNFKIGTDKIHVDSSLTRLDVPGRSKARRIFWFDRDVADDADGIISPVTLADDIVTLQFRPTAPAERTIEFPVTEDVFRGLFHPMPIGKRELSVKFAPFSPRNIATAAAGAQIAELFDGHWAGVPEPVLIRLGIKRPGRPMALRRPLPIADLSIKDFLVRTADYRGNFQLPPDEQKEADEDEIVVTGKTSKGHARLWLTLGQETLGRCSSLSHDKIRKLIVLHCAS
jgi:hypothetical protein